MTTASDIIAKYGIQESPKWLPLRTIFLTKHGSHAYGLNTPTSDVDIKGIAIPPQEYFLGFMNRFEQAEAHKPFDTTIYDIRKFFNLAAQCNPNIIEVLWTDPKDHLLMTPYGEMLLAIKEKFLSKKAKFTFSGYAIAQLKRIKTHRRWLLNPVTKEPKRSDFCLPETHSLVSADQVGAATKLQEEGKLDASPEYMAILQKEQQYRHAHQEWTQYQNWRETRNPKRAEIEAKYGFDCKHAMHLVRLMRMCREILTDGKVDVRRPDREELLAIRNGAWSYDQLMEWAEQQDAEMNVLYESSTLRHHPDMADLDRHCIEIVEMFLKQYK